MEVGGWRGWGEARNRRRDRGRGCSEMAPGRELKAAGGGSGGPQLPAVPRRGSPSPVPGHPAPRWGPAGSEYVGLIVYKAKELFGVKSGYLR